MIKAPSIACLTLKTNLLLEDVRTLTSLFDMFNIKENVHLGHVSCNATASSVAVAPHSIKESSATGNGPLEMLDAVINAPPMRKERMARRLNFLK